MVNKLLSALTCTFVCAFTFFSIAQSPNLGTSSNFSLFTTSGAITNTGTSQITGDVGSNNGPVTGFGNVNGTMHNGDAATAQCAVDVLAAYNELDAAIPTNSPAPSLGSGQTLFADVHSISGNTTINGTLTLDGENDPDAVFIFQIDGTLSTGAATKVQLINGAKACNVFWKVEGAVNLATATVIRGTIIANNASIDFSIGDTLEGRAFSTAGAITLNEMMVYTPIGCGSPVLNGPTAPDLGATACYGLFSSDGSVSNTGTTYVTGDIGSNTDSPTGYDEAFVTGTIHLTPDPSTQQCAADLLLLYTYVNALPSDIELLYPAEFGHNLVLTPHTYLMDAAAILTDTVYLNAMDNPDAVFVIQVNGAFTTGTNSNVVLQNGAQSENVFWKIEGAVAINTNSVFRGTIICNNAAIGNSGVLLDGRALITTGAVTTNSTITTATNIPVDCASLSIRAISGAQALSIFPNPASTNVTVKLSDESLVNNCEIAVYDVYGKEKMRTQLRSTETIIDVTKLPAGAYYYKLASQETILQTGKLIVQ